MIVWQGFGLAAVLIPILTYVVTVKLLRVMLSVAYTDTHAWPGALGTFLGAGLVLWLGIALDKPGRTLVDPKTGQAVVLRRKHTLFWIPLQYLAAILAVVALGMLAVKSSSPL